MKTSFLLFSLFITTSTMAQSATSWSKSYKGTIDKYPITMHLHQMGSEVKGYYYYDNKQIPIFLMGKGTATKITLNNSDENGEKFDLSVKGSALNGTWKSGKKILKVVLTSISQEPAFDMVYAKGEQKMFPKWKEGSPTADYVQASIWAKGTTPLAIAINNHIRKSFDEKSTNNEEVGKIFLRQKKDFFAEFFKEKPTEKEAKEMGNAFTRSLDDELLLMYKSAKYLTLAHTTYTYTGGAHGNYGTSYIALDANNGKRLMLKDIMTTEQQKRLPQLLEKYFRQTYKVKPTESLQEGGLFENKIPGTENFYLTDTGIGFAYPPYEIGPYVMGQVEIFVPFSEVRKK